MIGLCVSACVFVIIGGCHTKKTNMNDISISEYLIQKVEKGNQNDFTTALFLLSHLSLNKNDIMKLNLMYQNEQDPIKKLFIVYTLYQRTMEKNYENVFIKLYPIGEQQKLIWKLSKYESQYISVSSPLQQRLADFAVTNKEAFSKLLTGYKYADGSDGDGLSDQIANIYKYNQEYVLEELKKNNIDLSEFGIK
jgi:hypothetical protein